MQIVYCNRLLRKPDGAKRALLFLGFLGTGALFFVGGATEALHVTYVGPPAGRRERDFWRQHEEELSSGGTTTTLRREPPRVGLGRDVARRGVRAVSNSQALGRFLVSGRHRRGDLVR